MRNNARLSALLALLIALMTLAGCRQSGTTINIEETDPADFTQENYPSAGYYTPDSDPVYYSGVSTSAQQQSDTIIAAPDSITDWADARATTNEQVIEAPAVNSMTRGDFTYGIVVDQGVDIHPLRTMYKDMYSVNKLVFESLIELDENLQPVPLLADTWSNESNVWTFHLRSGVQFHNGKPFTAADVVASYQQIMQTPGTYWYELAQYIDTIEALDDLTLQVTSKFRGYLTLYTMTFPVVEASTVNSACMGLDMPMGTGPYWIIQYDEASALRLETNPLWWKRGSGSIQSIVVLFYKNVLSALTGLELDEIDALATDYPSASLSKNLSDRMTINYSTQTYECIVPNTRGAILSDLSVRQALMYAIDRSTLGNTIYAGQAQESEVPVIPGSYLYDAQATRYNYSPERALQILHEAGWEDLDSDGILEKNINGSLRTLSLRLFSYDRGTTATRSEAVELIAKQLRSVGFNISVEVGTAERVKKRMADGDFDLVLCGYEIPTVPNLAFLLAATGNSNYSSYHSDTMDGALHDAYYAEDASTLSSALSRVQLLVVEDLPILGLFFRSGVLASRQSMGGLKGTWQYDVLRGLATSIPTK